LIWLEIARNGIGDHNIQFSERIALGRDATFTGAIPTRHITAGSRARFNVKDDKSKKSLILHTFV
jgi:acetyltransferase-like isoleucine patch superfamily enzyme